jgi:hypothetical protein
LEGGPGHPQLFLFYFLQLLRKNGPVPYQGGGGAILLAGGEQVYPEVHI